MFCNKRVRRLHSQQASYSQRKEMKWWIILAAHYIVATAAYIKFPKHEIYSDTNWVTLVDFDTTIGNDCPYHWQKIVVNNRSMCQTLIPEAGCSSTILEVNGKNYSKAVGMVRGYQKGTTDGFRASHDDGFGINGAYVDGVSITIGYPRKHVWTYAAGLSAEGNQPKGNCPCSVIPGPDPPSFVEDDYYCQSGSQLFPDHDTYNMLPLWIGHGCTNDRDNCCANAGLPWFYREFPAPQHENIEVRICCNQDYSDEAVLVDKLCISISE